MSNLRQAAQQALEALEGWDNHDKWVWPESALEQAKRNTKEAIPALRAALAEPEQEPISLNNGRLTQYPDGSIGVGTPAEPEQEPVAWGMMLDGQIYDCICPEEHAREEGEYTIPLYAAPTSLNPSNQDRNP